MIFYKVHLLLATLNMGNSEIEDYLLSIGEPKLHGEMCKSLCASYVKVLAIFPDLEAARPRSTSGIQALCALHIALEKSKNILQHCAECSKLYLAITGDSVVLKFEKARCTLADSLRRVENIVPEAIGSQIAEILGEVIRIEFSLDPVEKQIGNEVISLLQQGRKFNSESNDNNELESFHQAASKLGISSSRAAVREKRALKKIIERARAEDDKRKESIVAYLMHLLRKYSKLFRSDFSDENDSPSSTPISPTINGCFFDRQMSKLSSFNFKSNFTGSELTSVPPEELRCPISLQLMYDPVIVASGQTYERVCIEKWFTDGHNTCPKTQLHLPHLSLTPNYCVKGMVSSWCEQNAIPVPDGPPVSLDLNYWRLVLSESDLNSKSIESVGSRKSNGGSIIEEAEENDHETISAQDGVDETHAFGRYGDFLTVLEEEDDLMKKCSVVKQIRHLLKDDEDARIYMGANGFVEPLLRFLESAVSARNGMAQEMGSMALFNLAVNNNRNKKLMLAAAVLPILEKMIVNADSTGAATALYLNLSCLEEAKPIIGNTKAVPFLISVLKHEKNVQYKLDALHTLYNISSNSTNIPHLLSSGIIDGLETLITHPSDHVWTEKCIAVVNYIASSKTARDEIITSPGLISGLANILDAGEPVEQEQAAACLVVLCNENEKCSELILEEGVITSLVSMSVNGTMRGKQKAQKLLMLFREQRQRDPSPEPESSEINVHNQESKLLSKSVSRRKVGRSLTFWRRKTVQDC